MSTLYIDEATGSDTTGTGTQAEPYQTLGYALYANDASGDSVKYLIRKDATTQYDEPTQSSLKKAKKTADGLEKKRKKAEELADKEAKEKAALKEKREKLLEESKKIVLEEDQALPKATRVHDLIPYKWIHDSILDFRPKFPNLLPSVVSVCAFLDGYIVCVIKRVSSSSFYVMVLVIYRASSLVVWYVPGMARALPHR